MSESGPHMDRRTFLRNTAAVAALSALTPLAAFATEDKESEFSPNSPEGEIESKLSNLGKDAKEEYGELVKNFTEILEDSNQRELFLHDLGGKVITLGASLPYLLPMLDIFQGFIRQALDPDISSTDLKEIQATESKKSLNELDLTDIVHPQSENLAQYRNLGVIHAGGSVWEKQKNLIHSAIAEADIILLENGDPGGWFDQIERYARDSGNAKRAMYIEGGGGVAVATIASVLGLWCVVDMMQLNPLIRAQRPQWTTLLAKSWVYQQLGLAPASSFVEKVIRKGTDSDVYPGRFSFDYVRDVRTLWMWANIQKVRQDPKNLNKKILSITGDAHAKGFEHYKEHDAELMMKRILYNIVFCLHHAREKMTMPERI